MHIVITGITRGLGRALADWCIAQGHTVSGCGRSGMEIFELRAANPEPHNFDTVDVTETIKVGMWAERIIGAAGVPDVLVNNAGLINKPAPLWEVPAAEFSKVIDVNLKGVANVIRAFVPSMVDAGRGVIVNLSSGWGRSTSPKVAPYCATKWGLEGLTQALAQELPAGMAAVPLNPGIVNTDMLRIAFGEGAGAYPGAAAWASRAGPFILQLGPKDNGKPLSVPGASDD